MLSLRRTDVPEFELIAWRGYVCICVGTPVTLGDILCYVMGPVATPAEVYLEIETSFVVGGAHCV